MTRQMKLTSEHKRLLVELFRNGPTNKTASKIENELSACGYLTHLCERQVCLTGTGNQKVRTLKLPPKLAAPL